MASMKKKRNTRDIQEQLRDAILNCGMSRHKLSQISGVATSQLCFFVNRERSLTMTSAAKVAKTLGLELTETER
jgi:plasmid maintenance system antidote protein VapI